MNGTLPPAGNPIPELWELWKISHAFDIIGSGTTPSTSGDGYYDGPIPWLNTGDLNDSVISEIKKSVTSRALADHSALQVFVPGSLIVAMYGATIGKLGILDAPACVNQACCVLSGPTNLHLGFTFYWLWANRRNIIELAKGGGQPNISQGTIRQLRVAAPPLPTQKAIADFLDRKTAAIDALIEKKQKLLDLLAEKRAALINQAVTKGLDPGVPMKDSGIPWIGEIPGHWEVKRFRFLLERGLRNGIFKKRDQFGRGTALVNVGDIYSDTFTVDTEHLDRVETNVQECRAFGIRHGDIFFVRSSLKLEGVAASAYVRNPSEPMVFECHLVGARPEGSIMAPTFLVNFLNSISVRQRLVSLANTTTMTTIAQDRIADLRVPVPPVAEQRAIGEQIGRTHRGLAGASDALFQQIDRLQEYRQALITAAVTGQLTIPEEAV